MNRKTYCESADLNYQSNQALIVRRSMVAFYVLAIFAILVCGTNQRVHAAEVIEQFDVIIEVEANGTLTVTETIRVRAEGREIKRGIYRDISLAFIDDEGCHRQATFKLLDVRRDGRPQPYFTERNYSGIRINAGEQNVFLQPGTYTYRFRYEYGRQIRFLADHDELFWNVTGNEWAFPIRSASVTIRLPQNAAPVHWTAYTGYFGERGRDWRGEVASDGALRVTSTRPLALGEGLSVVVKIPAGLVQPPPGRQQLEDASVVTECRDFATALKFRRPLPEQGHADALGILVGAQGDRDAEKTGMKRLP